MPDRRQTDKNAGDVNEDAGIFKRKVVEVRLELAPMRKRSSRGDLVCIGYIGRGEVEVIFPGRRKSATGPLEAQLSAVAGRKQGGGRLPIKARGIWRTRLIELDDVESKRVYQFLVAEWIMRGANGVDITYGEPPRR